MSPAGWEVHKFGGTSLAGPEAFRRVAALLAGSRPLRRLVVASAMAGVTDRLVRLPGAAARRDDSWRREVALLESQHLEVARRLVGPELPAVESALREEFAELVHLLEAAARLASVSPETADRVAGYGELWSSRILCAHLAGGGASARWLDARRVLVARPGETGVLIDWEASRRAIDSSLGERELAAAEMVVVPGYVASTPGGVPTTLGRNGSDLSATALGALLAAESVTIWKDVDGVMSADPAKVPDAFVLPDLTYHEAAELAYFGARVLHPAALAPAFLCDVPVLIRNTFAPLRPGTRIGRAPAATDATAAVRPVKGFSVVDGLAMLNLEGTGMVGVPGVARRLFGALQEAGISVVMISQGSSEHSICCAVPRDQEEAARRAVEAAFAADLAGGRIQTIETTGPYSILAAVGEQMVARPGVAARLFGALAEAGVNVRAIAQGASERNITVAVAQGDAARALRAVHAGFTLSDQTLSLGLIGPGLVGSALLAQLAAQAPVLRDRLHIDLRVRAIAGSRRMVLAGDRIDLAGWRRALEDSPSPADLEALEDHVGAERLPHAVVVDCTASEAIAGRYASWLERGIHVVTPNKKANSGPLAGYRRLKDLEERRGVHYLYEATVGAGLPVITTLRDLIRTGDRVERIEGVLSGTLSFVCNQLASGRPFSSIVSEARRRGYTEPDPREDLSGTDVARKLIILAREMGLEIELDRIEVESLVPESLGEEADPERFLALLAGEDERIRGLCEEAAGRGLLLRHVGVVEAGGRAAVGLRGYPAGHPFAALGATDNVIAFTTARYRDRPLVVQGPGAGPDVTAGGVFADLLRLAGWLGGRR